MSNDINSVFLIGRLTAAPEMKYTKTGTAHSEFTIANNRTWRSNDEKKESVSFFICSAWGKFAEIIAKHCTKGMRIGITGHMEQHRWEDKDGAKRSSIIVEVENLQFLNQTSEKSNNSEQDKNESDTSGYDDIPPSQPFGDDDVPM